MLQLTLLRLLFIFNLARSPNTSWINSTNNAIELVLNLPTTLPHLFELCFGSLTTKAHFPGLHLKRHGLGFAPFSSHNEKKTERAISVEQISLPTFLAPQVKRGKRSLDLVERPSASEARVKALLEIPVAATPPDEHLYDPKWTISSQYPFVGSRERLATSPLEAVPLNPTRIWLSLLTMRRPPAPFTAVDFLELGPYTILVIPPGSAYQPEMTDIMKIAYWITIILLPPVVIFFFNPFQLYRLRLSFTHGLLARLRILAVTVLFLRPVLETVLDMLTKQLSSGVLLFLKAPELPEEYLMTSEKWMERLKRSKEDDLDLDRCREEDHNEVEVYVIPQRRNTLSVLESVSMVTMSSNWVVLETQNV